MSDHQPRLFSADPDMRPMFPADITENRHGGNPQSVAAHAETPQRKREADRARIVELVRTAPNGLTADEAAVAMAVGVNTISGRFSELVRDGVLRRDGTRPTRSGARASVHFVAR